jgi:hypothetical protein
MTKHKLSPEAEAAWNAYCDVADRIGVFEDTGEALAAFLRELITQIEFRGELGLTPLGAHGHYQEKLYAIATELEGYG